MGCHSTSADATGVIKYGFKIKTRSGTVVDNLMFAARDRLDAERKVTQIYQQCEILDCREMQQTFREEGFDLESAINLINRESGPVSPAKN
jgi:hypothetical protein